ncbi:hypothetical protein AB0O07_25560 [Streptomyces sp. NPDC093085]|uniref:hypothetical protein n=1 Tax=Streptomyces sp. NPDC093085 TaxID=3155068 RepID=UPI0034227A77
MSTTTTRIDGVRGHIHTGPGDQHIHLPPGALTEDSKGRTPRAIADAELHWLRKHFVEPEGYVEAQEALEDHRLVLLDGAAGAGRSATARVLLHRLPSPGRRSMHEVLLEKDDENSPRALDPELIEEDGRLLLDLADESDRRWPAVRDELSALRAVLPERRAALVVVLPHGVRHLVPTAMSELHHVVSRAPGQELDIVKRHLRAARLDPTLADSAPPDLVTFLERAPAYPLSEVARFAQYLCRAAAAAPLTSFGSWCEQAHAALSERAKDAQDLLRRTAKGAPRALLVAAAMLHGARGDAVHSAASRLLADDQTVRVWPPLRHRPLSERLEAIEAHTDADHRVRFTGIDLDAAVRGQVWADFPALRDALCDWVGEILTLPELDEPDREALVSRFAVESLAARRPDDLLALSERWTGAPAERTRLLAAARALRHGLHHREFGRRFRGRIYDWARSPRLSTAQRQVLVDVCLADMAVRHPHAALVRLHHLARHERPGTLARDALKELLRDDPRLLRWMLNRLTGAHTSFWEADAGIFLTVAEPGPLADPGPRARPLIAEPVVRHDLTVGWTRVFRTLPPPEWTPRVHSWLAAACGPAPDGELFLDVLVAACGLRGDRFGALYDAGSRWAAGQPVTHGRARAVPERLLDKISGAQRAAATAARAAAFRAGKASEPDPSVPDPSARETTEPPTP